MAKKINTKAEKIAKFDPNSPGSGDGNLYGLPFSEKESEIIVIPVPWEATVSYTAGCAAGPEAIFNASKQLDLYDTDVKDAWKMGIYMLENPKKIVKLNAEYRKKAEKYISWYVSGDKKESKKYLKLLEKINKKSELVNDWVRTEALRIIADGKIPSVVGGEHSVPLGLIQALGTKYKIFSILQIDAHADLRIAYEGFENSHASIMYNALKVKSVDKLVQVGIRDFCQEELEVMKKEKGRVKTYFDKDLAEAAFGGKNWKKQCEEIISNLSESVYISFDIDGLLPYLCPNTGTPVAGGLEYNQAAYLIKLLAESGKKIIGFDLCEVAPGAENDEWDGNVGARILMRLANYTGLSQNKNY
jgi:agmatinase